MLTRQLTAANTFTGEETIIACVEALLHFIFGLLPCWEIGLEMIRIQYVASQIWTCIICDSTKAQCVECAGHCKSGRKIAADFQALHHIFSVVLVSQRVRRYCRHVRHMEDLGFFSSHLIIMRERRANGHGELLLDVTDHMQLHLASVQSKKSRCVLCRWFITFKVTTQSKKCINSNYAIIATIIFLNMDHPIRYLFYNFIFNNMHMFYICLCVFVVSECAAGRFGSDCQDRCECQNSGQCDRQTGQCVCQPGWTGERCENGKVI